MSVRRGQRGVRREGEEPGTPQAKPLHLQTLGTPRPLGSRNGLPMEGCLRATTSVGGSAERREKIDAAFKNTTLEMLLTHRAGLPHDGPSYGKAGTQVTEQRLAYLDAAHPIQDGIDAGTARFPSKSGHNYFDDTATPDVVEAEFGAGPPQSRYFTSSGIAISAPNFCAWVIRIG